MVIYLEGCETMTRDQLREAVYNWYMQHPRRLVTRPAGPRRTTVTDTNWNA